MGFLQAHDRLLGGDIRLNTKLNQVSYTCAHGSWRRAELFRARAAAHGHPPCLPLCPARKKYDVQSVTLGVSAIYDYNTHTPYCGRAALPRPRRPLPQGACSSFC